MSFDSFLFAVRNAFHNVIRNSLLTLASIIVLSVSLLALGSTYMVIENVNHFVDSAASENQIVIFLEETLTDEQITQVGEQLKEINNLTNIEYESPEQALENYKQQIGEENIEGLDATVFRPSYIFDIIDLNKYDQTIYSIEQIEGLGKFETGEKAGQPAIRSSHEVVSAIVNIRQVLSIFSAVMIAIFFILSIFIITNSVKLSVFSRRTEISIMKYVGAADFYIQLPYFIEGLIIGLVSGILSYFLQRFLYDALLAPIIQDFGLGAALNMNEHFSFLFLAFLIAGGIVGIIGSVFPVKKYLKV